MSGGVTAGITQGEYDAAQRVGEQHGGAVAGAFVYQLSAQVVVVQAALLAATTSIVILLGAKGVNGERGGTGTSLQDTLPVGIVEVLLRRRLAGVEVGILPFDEVKVSL